MHEDLSLITKNENDGNFVCVFNDSATGATLNIKGSYSWNEPMTEEEMKQYYPQNLEEAKAAASVVTMYTYDNFTYSKTDYGCKFSYRVLSDMDDTRYPTVYYFVSENFIIVAAFDELDSARPFGELFSMTVAE